MKGINILCLCIVLTVSVLSAGCSSAEINLAAAEAINENHLSGIQVLDEDITRMDKDYYAVLVKIKALESLIAPAMQWVEFHKTQSYDAGAMWIKEVTSEGLSQLANDQYKVNKLELVAKEGGHNVGWQFSQTLTVTDVASGRSYDAASLLDDLKKQKATWEDRRKEKIASRDLATSTMANVLKFVSQWKVEKYNAETFLIKGAGLGWQDKLVDGTWTYYIKEEQAQPNGKPAEDLQKVISAR